MHVEQEYLKISEAAKLLGVTLETVRRRIREGKLPQRRTSGSFSAPIMVHMNDLRAMMKVVQDLDLGAELIDNDAPYEARLAELHRRCLKLAAALGSKRAIDEIIRRVGGAESGRLEDVDPARYGKLRYALTRLANPMTGGAKGPHGRFVKRTPVADARGHT